MTTLNDPVPERLMRVREVCAATGLSHSVLYDRMKNGEFPKSIPLGGRAVAWSSVEVNAWIQQRIAERDGRDNKE
nr:transcriptional regulator [Saccharospirillaceae bacterium]